MHFLLAHLSFADLCFTSVTVPKLLANLVAHDCSISLAGCLTQTYFFFALGVTDSCLLAAMAYDHYMAIQHPLHYATRMSRALCTVLVGTAWLVSHVHSLLHILLMARLSFCTSHFFCDHQPLLRLPCSDTHHIQLLIFMEGATVLVTPFLLILASYGAIAAAVLRLPSASRSLWAVSTVAPTRPWWPLLQDSHRSLLPAHILVRARGRATVMYTVVIPILNLVIYSLQNCDVWGRSEAFSLDGGSQLITAEACTPPRTGRTTHSDSS